MPNLNLFIETNDQEELSRLLQLVLGCAVNCDKKSEYIKIIMEMHVDTQHMIMTAIQDVRLRYCRFFFLKICLLDIADV
jgi:hypothetical protein